MRLFVALDIENGIRERIATFMNGVNAFAPDARWVPPESLHVTLKFIGGWERDRLPELEGALQRVHAPATQIAFRGHGFFPAPRSARVFWAGIEADSHLGELATAVDEACARIAIAREDRAFSPHLTLARGKSGSPVKRKNDHANRKFERLQQKLEAMPAPDFGTMTAREFFLYESKLSPAGPHYTKLKRFELH
jgi:RNA 2',3'-cyclic 3'-phosphodiesterase